MSRRSTNLGNFGLYQLTCDSCWDGFNFRGYSWGEAEREANREGWRFEGHGMSAREYCERCA